MKPEQELEKLAEKRAKMASFKRWIRRSRWMFSGMVALLLVYAVVSYQVYTVPGVFNPDSSSPQSPILDVQPEDILLLQKLNLWRDPKVEDVVIYNSPDGTKTLVGRVAGLPGETLKRSGPTMSIASRDALAVGFSIGMDEKVKDGDVIPEGQYLIVNDTDGIAASDSRTLGYIAREDIVFRVSTNITMLFGRAKPLNPQE
ncbi:signal peptidase I [Planctomycetota bacterium]|nr:signal peptidase I [Planctomycetota bacterium]